MEEIEVFSSDEFGEIRVIQGDDGETWFVASDVAKVLGYRDAHNMTRRLDDDEKGTRSVSTPGGIQKATCISEAGLYSSVLGSKVPRAKAFKRWVTHEVLPSIRRRGGYMAAPPEETPMETVSRALLIAQDALQRKEERIAQLAPKAEFCDRVTGSGSLILVRDMAKLLSQNGVDTGGTRLYERLRADGFIEKHRTAPTQRAIDMGLMQLVEHTVRKPDGEVRLSATPKITGKGQAYFMRRYAGCIAGQTAMEV